MARNIALLMSGQFVSALLGLAYLAVSARAVGPEGLGLLAIALTYLRIINRLFRLEPWQAAIRFGIKALEEGNAGGFKQIIKFSILVDAASGVLACIGVLGAAYLVAPMLKAPQQVSDFLLLLAATALLDFRSTGIAILRIFDRFDLLAKVDVAIAAARLVLGGLAYAAGLGLWGFLLIAVLEGFANGLLPFAIGRAQLRKRNYSRIMAEPLTGLRTENSGILRLLWNSNFNLMIRQTAQRLDVIILSVLVDVREVGYYNVARRLAEAAMKISRPLMQVIFPEFARLWSTNKIRQLRRLVVGGTLSICLVGLFVLFPIALVIPDILTSLVGEEFVGASQCVSVQLGAVVIFMSGTVVSSGLMSMGRDAEVVWITLAGSAVFLLVLAPLVLGMGIVGASVAHVLFNSIMTIGFYAIFARSLKRVEGRP
jgi:O-antigen/teichoic acid export membrane protein